MPQPGCAICVNLQLVYSRALKQQAEALHEQVTDFHQGDKELLHKLEQPVKEAEQASAIAKQALTLHDATVHAKKQRPRVTYNLDVSCAEHPWQDELRQLVAHYRWAIAEYRRQICSGVSQEDLNRLYDWVIAEDHRAVMERLAHRN